jgi:MFS family permease
MPQKKVGNKPKTPRSRLRRRNNATLTFFGRKRTQILTFLGILKQDRTPLLFLVLVPVIIWLLALQSSAAYWGIESAIAVAIEIMTASIYAFLKARGGLSKTYIMAVFFFIGALPFFILAGFVLGNHQALAPTILQIAQGFLILSLSYITLLLIGLLAWTGLLLLEVFKKRWLIVALIALVIASLFFYQFILDLALVLAGGSSVISYVFKLWDVKLPDKARKSKEYKKKENELTMNATVALKYFLAAFLLILAFKAAVMAYPNFFSSTTINQTQVQPSISLVSDIGGLLYRFAVFAALVLAPVIGVMLFLIGIVPFFKMIGNLQDLKMNKV